MTGKQQEPGGAGREREEESERERSVSLFFMLYHRTHEEIRMY